MKIDDIKLLQYKIPLQRDLKVKNKTLEFRRGLILQLIEKEGARGYGEIAPLPGMSPETFQQAEEQIWLIGSKLVNQIIPSNLERLAGGFSSWLEGVELHPSVRFGLETAILTMISNQKNIPLIDLIYKNYAKRILISGLLDGTTEEVVTEAKEMIAQGYLTIKLKVGSADVKEDIEKTKAVCDVTQGKALMRLDANQGWTYEQAVQFGMAINADHIEYIEEPFEGLSRITEFSTVTSLSVALDESLNNLDFATIMATEGVETLIVKPMIFGGFERTWLLARWAQQTRLRVVISSAFESSLGLGALATLAAGLSQTVPMGLDTIKWFEKDLLNTGVIPKNGRLDIPREYLQPSQINYAMLR